MFPSCHRVNCTKVRHKSCSCIISSSTVNQDEKYSSPRKNSDCITQDKCTSISDSNKLMMKMMKLISPPKHLASIDTKKCKCFKCYTCYLCIFVIYLLLLIKSIDCDEIINQSVNLNESKSIQLPNMFNTSIITKVSQTLDINVTSSILNTPSNNNKTNVSSSSFSSPLTFERLSSKIIAQNVNDDTTISAANSLHDNVINVDKKCTFCDLQLNREKSQLNFNSHHVFNEQHRQLTPFHSIATSDAADATTSSSATAITRINSTFVTIFNQNKTGQLNDDKKNETINLHQVDSNNNNNYAMQRQNKLSVASSFVFNVNTDTNIYGSQSHSHHNNAGDRNNLLDLPSRPQIDWSNDNYRPIFEPAIGDQNVTAQLGKSTFLRCRIKQITDETVSWVRQHDLHIISAGEFVYTSDLRFKPKHTDNADDWYLHIEYVQKEDAGVYECQVSSEPRMSLSFILNVIESKSSIVEGPVASVKLGASVKLTCIINQTASPPLFIYWYKNQKVIDHGGSIVSTSTSDVINSGGRLSVSTEKGPTTISILRIIDITSEDAGNYSCTPIPTYTDSANVTLNVLNGENPAAISRNQRNPLTSNAVSIILMNLLLQPLNKWIAIRI